MRKKLMLFFLTQLLLMGLIVGCNNVAEDPGTTGDEGQEPPEDAEEEPAPEEYPLEEDEINTVQYDATPEMQGGSERDLRDPNPVSNVELQDAFPDVVTLQGSPDEKQVALTFDDGPDELITPAVLDKLEEYDVEATFFLIGERVEAHPDIVQRILDEGHVVANHSWNHPEFPDISDEDAEEQINRTESALEDVTGEEVRMFRPPYGAQNEDHVQIMDEMEYSNIIWSQDSLDWKDLEVEEVADNILSDISYGAIVLQHSAGLEGDEGLMVTVDALDKVIPALQEDDMEFVTVDEMLDIPAYR